MTQAIAQTRLRVTFTKTGPLRYTSHLDLARVWERLVRRAALPVIYSQGFNPRPKLQLAAALPLGFTSRCEVLDMWLAGDTPPPLRELAERLQDKAPPGLDVMGIEVVDLRGPALQSITREATYHVAFAGSPDAEAVRREVERIMAADEILRERRGKAYDLRPLILSLEMVEDASVPGGLRLEVALRLQEGATGRPDELLDEMGIGLSETRVERVAIGFGD